MQRKKFFKLSLWLLITGIIFIAISYFFFHFVTDDGITFVWHAECGKPFVTEMIADFGVISLFFSFLSLLVGLIFTDKN